MLREAATQVIRPALVHVPGVSAIEVQIAADEHGQVVDVVSERDRSEREGVAMTPTLARNMGDHRELFLGDLSDLKVLRAFLMQLDG